MVLTQQVIKPNPSNPLDMRSPIAHVMRMATRPPKIVREWLSEQGKKNAGKPCPNRKRGDAAYYSALAKQRWDAVKAAQLIKEAQKGTPND